MSSKENIDTLSINKRICIAFDEARHKGIDALTLEQFNQYSILNGIESRPLILAELETHGVKKNRITIRENGMIRQTQQGEEECAQLPKQGGSALIK